MDPVFWFLLFWICKNVSDSKAYIQRPIKSRNVQLAPSFFLAVFTLRIKPYGFDSCTSQNHNVIDSNMKNICTCCRSLPDNTKNAIKHYWEKFYILELNNKNELMHAQQTEAEKSYRFKSTIKLTEFIIQTFERSLFCICNYLSS